VLHTHGRNGQYHPHLPLIATSGGYDGQGERWEPIHYWPYELLRRKCQWYLLSMVRRMLRADVVSPPIAVRRVLSTCRRSFLLHDLLAPMRPLHAPWHSRIGRQT
jgi:hypothetical protein